MIKSIKHIAPCGITTTNTISVSEITGDATVTTIERLPRGNFITSISTFEVLPPNAGKGCPFTRALESARFNPYAGGRSVERDFADSGAIAP